MVQSKNIRTATESYVDSKVAGGGSSSASVSYFTGVVTPPVGMYLTSPGIYNFGGDGVTNKQVRFVPIWVPTLMTIDAFRIRIIDSASGGNPIYRIGLFNSNSHGLPDCSMAPLGVANISLSTNTSNSGSDFLANKDMVLQPGLYWIGDHYKYTVSPTSGPSFMSYKETVTAFPTDAYMDINLRGKSLIINDQDDFPTNNSYSLGLNTNNANPYIILRRKA